MKRRRMFALLALIIICILTGPVAVRAEGPYKGYNYDSWGNSVPSAVGYLPQQVIKGEDLGIGAFKGPQDVFVKDNKELYLIDTGNGRIVILDSQLKLKKVITKFTSKEGNVEIKEGQGIFVSEDGKIYVADKGNKCVLVMDQDGNVLRKITKPVSELIPDNFDYQPQKVLADSSGTVYVLAYGMYKGALTFDENNKFMGFYGSNKINVTSEILANFIWKKILSADQVKKMVRAVPVEYNSFDIDKENFIYTCTSLNNVATGQIKKLNPQGANILWAGKKDVTRNYGDLEKFQSNGKLEDTVFVDVKVDDKGFINALDRTRGRIFQYDQNSNLLYTFGGIGNQEGTFKNPVAVECMDDKVLVLDATKNVLTVFYQTTFGQNVRKAVELYDDGRYEEAVQPWKEVLKEDSNYELAYEGIGKALRRTGDFKDALKDFKLGYAVRDYSEAFREYRTEYIRSHFSVVALIIILVIAIPLIIGRLRKGKKEKTSVISTYKYPFYIMLHPIKGYEELRWNKAGSLKVANIILLAWFIVAIFARQETGFIFNPNRVDKLNIFMIMISTFALFFLWSVSNWSLCTLVDGEGKFRDIWIASAYALLPYVLLTIPITILSNFLVTEEGVFLAYAGYIAVGWSFITLMAAIQVTHQFNFKKTIVSIIISCVGILVIIFLGILVYSLFQQLYSFLFTIYNEILFRL